MRAFRIESTMYFGSGSLVAAVNVLLVVALVVVALLVMPLIHDYGAADHSAVPRRSWVGCAVGCSEN